MSATPTDIRRAIAARVTALSGWRESTLDPEALGRDPSTLAHQTFAVVVPESIPEAGRQRASAPQYVRTSGTVRFLWRMSPKDQVDTYDALVDADLAVLRQLTAAGWTGTFHWLWDGTTRSTHPDAPEWRMAEIRFSALHYLSLS